MFEEVKAYHHKLERDGYGDISISEFEEVDKGHGRLEVRRYQHFEFSNWVENKKEWKGATSIIRVEQYRLTPKGESSEVACYLSSLDVGAFYAAKAVRGHWEVENKLHWRLDVIFKEDDCQLATAATNIAVIKRFCMNLLSINDTSKEAMKRKVMSCAISDEYREKILLAC